MTSIPEIRSHSTGLEQVLAATGVPVGRGDRPAETGWQGAPGQSVFVAYLELHPIPGGFLDGPLGCPDDDLDGIWQVTAVGGNQEQCELAADLARTALLTQIPTVVDRAVCRVSIDLLSGARRDDTVTPPVWISTDRFRFSTTPS